MGGTSTIKQFDLLEVNYFQRIINIIYSVFFFLSSRGLAVSPVTPHCHGWGFDSCLQSVCIPFPPIGIFGSVVGFSPAHVKDSTSISTQCPKPQRLDAVLVPKPG